ncbi:actin [Podila minutissima]|uniref:Actin n=1 Tax=Podila minutissima TaxID=64525 RepID=A0A9P5SRJ3_9FUNG|nr:actin [Podila minutissima]
MEKIWSYTLADRLSVSPDEQPVLMTETALNRPSKRERTTELFFENFGVPAFYLEKQAVLSLYSTGLIVGLVVESGGVTHIVSIFYGNVATAGVKQSSLAGGTVAEHFTSSLGTLGLPRVAMGWHAICDIKERLCVVADSFQSALAQDSDAKDYELPDGIIFSFGSVRFQAPEVLFSPHLHGLEREGIHQTIDSVIGGFEDLGQALLCQSVVLVGGCSLLPGLASRLEFELERLGTSIETVVRPDRKHAAWVGGSLLTASPDFEKRWITKAEYEESGAGIVRIRCI